MRHHFFNLCLIGKKNLKQICKVTAVALNNIQQQLKPLLTWDPDVDLHTERESKPVPNENCVFIVIVIVSYSVILTTQVLQAQ